MLAPSEFTGEGWLSGRMAEDLILHRSGSAGPSGGGHPDDVDLSSTETLDPIEPARQTTSGVLADQHEEQVQELEWAVEQAGEHLANQRCELALAQRRFHFGVLKLAEAEAVAVAEDTTAQSEGRALPESARVRAWATFVDTNRRLSEAIPGIIAEAEAGLALAHDQLAASTTTSSTLRAAAPELATLASAVAAAEVGVARALRDFEARAPQLGAPRFVQEAALSAARGVARAGVEEGVRCYLPPCWHFVPAVPLNLQAWPEPPASAPAPPEAGAN